MEYKPSFADQLDVDYISHHGIKGQKWGVRRYQNSDGSLTDAGKKKYAVKENKGGLLGFNRTFMDSDLKKANEKGGTINRDAVLNNVRTSIKNDPKVKAAQDTCQKSARESYAAYANLYNKHAADRGIKQRLNPKTFNWYKQMDDLDYDVDMAVWDDKSKDAKKLYSAQNKHEKNVDKLMDAQKSVIDRYINKYQDAVLKDIPNDGSKQAVNRILKKYGNMNYFDIHDHNDTNNPNYGWDSYQLFDA